MSKLESLATSITNASQMYSLNGGKYISITLGGREWTATYMSKSKTGDTILTLWSVINSAGTGLGLSSTWSSGWLEEDNENDPYPSNMYGTSFIRAVTLNNGGLYATSGTTSSTVEKDANNKFALFTMEEYGLTKYIVTPRQVSWQEKGQSARDLFEETNYNALNENWSQSLSVDGFSHNVNYAGKTGNDAWADDYIWLPSFSEVGFGTTSPSPNGNKRGYGLWRAGSSQVQAYYQYWFRSGPSGGSVSAYYCYNDASYVGINKVNLDYTSYKHDVYVRPALHLNLTEAVKNAK